MRTAACAEPVRGALEHQPLRDRDPPQVGDLIGRHYPWIDVRHQTGFVPDQGAHRGQILDGGPVSERGQGLAGGAVSQFGLIAQGKQRLLAPPARPGVGDFEHLVGGKIGWPAALGRPREDTVMADVAAKMGQWHEKFSSST